MEPPPISNIITFTYTTDLEASCKFYGEVLGLPMVLEQSTCRVFRIRPNTYVGTCETSWFERNPDEIEKRKNMLSIVTDNLEEWNQRMIDHGVEIVDPLAHHEEYGISRVLVRDPMGYFVEIMSFDKEDWEQA